MISKTKRNRAGSVAQGVKVGHVLGAVAVAALALGACQNYEYVFQPSTDRTGAHLKFTVQQPSKADLLFVIDNSGTMFEEQEALKASIGAMLDLLAPRDTSYRIGIVSTDAVGYEFDCCGLAIPSSGPFDLGGARGECGSVDCNALDAVCATDQADAACDPEAAHTIKLRRPHDGARGRLIAAYDPAVFDVDAVDVQGQPLFKVPPEHRDKLAAAFPTGPRSGPVGYAGNVGARAVIDRRAIRAEACDVCGCEVCVESDEDLTQCFATCAQPVARDLVTAYFYANVNALGTGGWGYEEGLRAGMLAVGVNPEDSNEETAIDPGSRLTRPGEANSFATYPTSIQAPTLSDVTIESWVRDDALLAIMYITDEEDCSVPAYVMDQVPFLEGQAGLPPGGYCYGQDRSSFLNVPRMGRLLTSLKGTRSRVAIGVIGGVENHGSDRAGRSQADATDCEGMTVAADEQPSTTCSCLTGADAGSAMQWCSLTQDDSGSSPTCDGLSGDRYLEFANEFDRRTFDSICREGQDAFGDALRDFAEIATLACFDLNAETTPAGGDAALITVERIPRDAPVGEPPALLPQVQPNAADVPEGGGWYYQAADNTVCLVGLDRLLGDRYDIFVLRKDEIDFMR